MTALAELLKRRGNQICKYPIPSLYESLMSAQEHCRDAKVGMVD